MERRSSSPGYSRHIRGLFMGIVLFGVLAQCMAVPIAMMILMPREAEAYRSPLIGYMSLFVLGGAVWATALVYIMRARRRRSARGRTVEDVAESDGLRVFLAKLWDKGVSPQIAIMTVCIVAALVLVGRAMLMTQAALDEAMRYDPAIHEGLSQAGPGWLLWLLSASAGVTLIAVLIVDGRKRIADRRAVVTTTGSQLAPPSVLAALDRISLAAGVTAPSLRIVHQAGVNGAITGPQNDRAIVLTTGAIQALDPAALEVLFANLLARSESGAVFEAVMADQIQQSLGSADLEQVNAEADARSLLLVRDVERVLSVMDSVARLNRRMELDREIPDACYFCWPHQPPPLDLPERVRRLAALAGAAGELWRRADQERRRAAAARELGME